MPLSSPPVNLPSSYHPPRYSKLESSLCKNSSPLEPFYCAVTMRLLQSNGHDSFSLTEFFGLKIPHYAILSHTWGADSEEVNFQDLGNERNKSKAGYEKLKFCATQAARDGLQYFWVDTCCIDKSNSMEVQHAINSMFRWYQNAARCYVYLSDVHTTTVNDKFSQVSWQEAFRTSRWFSRGWTLQELIAPEIVEFFSKEGKQLGDKRSLEQHIHEITGIPISALQGRPLSQYTVDERMSWGENRDAKYEEDKVYSIQGILDIYIPLIYSEGWERAMIRLRKGIQESSKSPLVFLKNDAHFIVPFDRNPHFTGRETQLAELEERLFERGQTTKFAITGLGGIGKTQLVLELVYRTREKYKNCSVIWIPATNRESLQQAYLNVAQKLGIAGWEEENTNVKSLVKDYLSNDIAGQWFLVFDNADDINKWLTQSSSELESGRLIDYLPRSEHGCIVFTTRDRKTAVKLAQKNIVMVPEMDESKAIYLLQKCLVNPDLSDNMPDAKVLVNTLTYLPLAIVQAAAYINENGITLSDYLSLLRDQEEVDFIGLLSEEFEDKDHTIKNQVATTWLISFEHIQRYNPLAAEYLSFMACIDSRDIPQVLLPAGDSRKKEIEAMGTLLAYSFITRQSSGIVFDIHRLVHLATRNWLRKEKLITQWTERVITRLEEVSPDDNHSNRNMRRMCLPHIRYALLSNAIDLDAAVSVELAWRFGMFLYSDGRFNEAEAQFVEVLERRMRVLGREHPSTLTSMANLASTYRNQGRWKEAEDLEVIVLEARQKVLGPEHPDRLTSMANMASTYRNQGREPRANELEIKAESSRADILSRTQSVENREEQESLDILTLNTRDDSDDGSDGSGNSEISDVFSVFSTTDSLTLSDSTDGNLQAFRSNTAQYLVAELLKEDELRSLYEVALTKLGKAKFAKAHDNLLKEFLMGLRLGATGNL